MNKTDKSLKKLKWPRNPSRLSKLSGQAFDNGVFPEDQIEQWLCLCTCNFGMPFTLMERCSSKTGLDNHRIISVKMNGLPILHFCNSVDKCKGANSNNKPYCVMKDQEIFDFYWKQAPNGSLATVDLPSIIERHYPNTVKEGHCLDKTTLLKSAERAVAPIEYLCEKTGLWKVALPIYFCNKIIAVLLTGQNYISNRRAKNIGTLNDACIVRASDSDEDVLTSDDYRNVLEEHLRSDLYGVSKIEMAEKSIITEDKWYENIFRVFSEIVAYENKIVDVYEEGVKSYLFNMQQDLTQKFNAELSKNLMGEDLTDDKLLEQYWLSFAKVLNLIIKYAPIKAIVLYGCMSMESALSKNIKLAGILIDESFDAVSFKKLPVKNSVTGILKEVSGEEEHSEKVFTEEILMKHFPNISECLDISNPSNFSVIDSISDKDAFLDKTYPKAYPKAYPVGMLVQFEDKVLFNAEEKLGREKSERLKSESFAESLLATFTSKLSWIFLTKQYEKVDEIFKTREHETSQVSTGLVSSSYMFSNVLDQTKRVVNEHMKDSTHFNDLEKLVKRSEIYYRDVRYFQTIITMQSSLFLDKLEPSKTDYFWPYGTFLYKWRENSYKMFEEKGLKLSMPVPSRKDRRRPEMFGCAADIEQVAFNFTTNAQKYSYLGTRVLLDCRLDKKRENYLLIMTNYGEYIPLSEREKIFEYGYRYDQSPSSKGMGIGLYTSKVIAVDHHGDIKCKSTIECKYNIGMIESFIELYEAGDESRKSKYLELYNDVKKLAETFGELINRMLSKDIDKSSMRLNAHLTFQDTLEGLYKETAKTVFTLSIPYKERDI